MRSLTLSLRGWVLCALIFISAFTAYWSVTLTADWLASKTAQKVAAGFGPEMAAVVVDLRLGTQPALNRVGVSWRIVTGDKFDEPTRRNWSETLFRLTPRAEGFAEPVLVRVAVQASALDASKAVPGASLADQLSHLSTRIAALNTHGVIKVQISTTSWVEFSAPETWDVRLTAVQIFLLGCLWVALLAILVGLASSLISRRFTKIAACAASLLNPKPPALLPESSGPTEVREISKALNIANQNLANNISERTRFLAAISHDLRTPATRMRLRAEQIEDDTVRGKLLSDLDEITNMITEAITFLRDGFEVEKHEEVIFTTFLESICDDYIDVGKNVTFQALVPLTVRSAGTIFDPRPIVYDMKGTRRITLRCQPGRLRRAINNLIDNALKYGDLARVNIQADARTITVRINDVGPGLTKDDMERVFQPFYRAEGSRARSSTGAGLGLPLAKLVVEAHGGTIMLFNHDRGGLEVRLTLPRTERLRNKAIAASSVRSTQPQSASNALFRFGVK